MASGISGSIARESCNQRIRSLPRGFDFTNAWLDRRNPSMRILSFVLLEFGGNIHPAIFDEI